MDVLKKIKDSGQVTDMTCDISALFKDIKILGTTSSSDSFQAIVKIKKPSVNKVLEEYMATTSEDQVFLKVGADLTQTKDNSTYIERNVYRYLSTYLLAQNRTPNLIRYVFSFECEDVPSLLSSLPGSTIRQVQERIKQIEDSNITKISKLNFTVLELGKGMELSKPKPDLGLLDRGGLSQDDFLAIMIQVCYTLAEMDMAEVRHNDLHLGNIWIDILPSPRRMIFMPFDGQYFVLETRYIPKIYDFDRSGFTIRGAPKNWVLEADWCPLIGVCENKNPGFDLFTVCALLDQNYRSIPWISSFVNTVIRNKTLLRQTHYNFQGRVCKKYGSPGTRNPFLGGNLTQRCEPDYVLSDHDIYTFESLWRKTTLFDRFKTSKLEEKDLPSQRGLFDPSSIPSQVFQTYFYVSQRIKRSPIEVANDLYQASHKDLPTLPEVLLPEEPSALPESPEKLPRRGERLIIKAPKKKASLKKSQRPVPRPKRILKIAGRSSPSPRVFPPKEILPEEPSAPPLSPVKEAPHVSVKKRCVPEEIPERKRLTTKSLVGDAFKEAKKLYGQTKDTFWISEQDILIDGQHTFIHKGVLQPYRQTSFVEYRPGVVDDIDKLYRRFADGGTFQSFYCGLCSSGEPHSVFNFSTTNQPVLVKNPAIELRKEIVVNGRKYFITGTTPQYLYNHLLLYPEDHISSYLVMLSRTHFKSIYEILYLHSPPETSAIFNGNFGSDVYHGHVHLTDQIISIVEESKKAIDKECRDHGAIAMRGPVVNAITLYAINLDELYDEAAAYFMLYFSPSFLRDTTYIGANMYVHLNKFAITIFIGDLSKKIIEAAPKTGECPVNLIAPAFVINLERCLSEGPISSQAIEKLKGSFIDPDVFKAIRDKITLKVDGSTERGITKVFDELSQTLSPVDIPAEIYQSQIFGLKERLVITPELCKEVGKYLTVVLSDPVECAKRMCAQNVFAAYKFVLTIWIMCLARALPNPKDYSQLYLTPQVLMAAIFGETYNLTTTFGIKDLTALSVRGKAASLVTRNTFSNLLGAVSKNPVNANFWMDYHFAKMGEPSAYGILTKSKLKYVPSAPFVLKINPGPPGNEFIYESNVGAIMTQLRAYVPNFVMFYGWMRCTSPENLSGLCEVQSGTSSRDVQYLLLEYLNGPTFAEYLKTMEFVPGKDFEVMCGIAQLALGLAYAQVWKKFVSYDLHTNNQIVVPTGTKFYEYTIAEQTYGIVAPYTPVVIDYGSSHVDGLKEYPHDPARYAAGQTTDKFKKTADCYTFLISVLVVLVATNKRFIVESQPIKDLYARFRNVYGSLFSKSLDSIIGEAISKGSSVEDLSKALTAARKDQGYYLYVPRDYDSKYGPLELYQDIKEVCTAHKQTRLFSRPAGMEVCRFGDIDGESGCGVDIEPYPKNQKVKIEKLKSE
jgi:serine/threonine protein kinase